MPWPHHLIHGVVMVSLLGVTCDDGHMMRDIPGIEAGWASLSSDDLARSRSLGAEAPSPRLWCLPAQALSELQKNRESYPFKVNKNHDIAIYNADWGHLNV